MRPSTTKLSQALVDFGAATKTFTATAVRKNKAPMAKGFGMSNETYGRDSKIYIDCPDVETRKELENYLWIYHDVTTVEKRYSPGSSTMEVGVTYFKGSNWDE